MHICVSVASQVPDETWIKDSPFSWYGCLTREYVVSPVTHAVGLNDGDWGPLGILAWLQGETGNCGRPRGHALVVQLIFQNRNLLQCSTYNGRCGGQHMEMSLHMTSGMLWMCCRILSYRMVPSDGVWKEFFFFFFLSFSRVQDICCLGGVD